MRLEALTKEEFDRAVSDLEKVRERIKAAHNKNIETEGSVALEHFEELKRKEIILKTVVEHNSMKFLM